MKDFYFYPTLTAQLYEKAGITCTKYSYDYEVNGTYIPLHNKVPGSSHLDDVNEVWKIETDGMRLERKVIIEYPNSLVGKEGIACKDAEIGVCIIWNCKKIAETNYIFPEENSDGVKSTYLFRHEFKAGEIDGNLRLTTVLYLKKKAALVLPGEEYLNNKSGVVLGVIDEERLDFGTPEMEFPIVEINDADQPLWWLELKGWEEPSVDQFDEEHVCLYLNSYYEECPKVGASLKNESLLVEIMSQAYLMMFLKLDTEFKDDGINAMRADIDLQPGSISKVLHYFYNMSDPKVDVSLPICELQRTIRTNVERMLKGTAND